MGLKIKLNYEELEAALQNFRATHAEIKTSVTRMQGVVQTLEDNWQGNAYVQYNAVMQDWNQVANRLLDDLETLNTLVDGGGHSLADTDNTTANAFKRVTF